MKLSPAALGIFGAIIAVIIAVLVGWKSLANPYPPPPPLPQMPGMPGSSGTGPGAIPIPGGTGA
ncbi:MAG TPA: hypothetical protein VK689_17160, partial [Armatimonadota bacterium]|nr:hypothetical protein [Armatimonadota bacterium]